MIFELITLIIVDSLKYNRYKKYHLKSGHDISINTLNKSHTNRYIAFQRLIVEPLVLPLDGGEVILRAARDDPHEGLVLGAGALHGVAEPRREPRGRVFHALH